MIEIDLSGKVALVTGAGRGIGLGCARALARAGAFVWVNDLDAEAARRAADEIGGKPLPGDVANPSDWLNPAIERGVLHILVHNAGYDFPTPMGATDMAAFDRLHRVQISGPFAITQMLFEQLKAANGAATIYIASVHATITEPLASAYAGGKAAQIAMVRGLALELGEHKIRALAVSPGYVDTALVAASDLSSAEIDALHPMGRMGQPEDIGNLVAFLASPLAEFVNGTNVIIDGALTARLYS
jgi:NAD(P)-dependent dehydrogenase (short-subunit alcohol dehydrogenase family)